MAIAMLGEFLTAVHAARASYATVHARIRYWYDADIFSAVQAARPRTSSRTEAALSTRLDSRQPNALDVVLQEIWFKHPRRWRIQTLSLVGPQPLLIVDGDKWWRWDGLHEAISNEESPEPAAMGGAFDPALVVTLDPVRLLGELSFAVTGEDVQAGQVAFRARAIPRDRDARGLWSGADDYDVLIDRQRGVLLRATARVQGREFAGSEVLDITYDEELPDDTFRLELPPGVVVQQAGRGRR